MLDKIRRALEQRLSKLIAGTQTNPQIEQFRNDQEVRNLQTQGNHNLASGDFSEAERCFREALHFNANNPDILTCLGYALKELGRYAEARVQLRRAITLLGNTPNSHEAMYLIGQIAEIEGDLQSAKNQYLNVLALKPDFTLACSDLCRIYRQTGDQSNISKLLTQCVTTCPLVVEYRYLYSNWLLEIQQYTTAINELDKLIDQNPGFAEAHNNRGVALQELNRIDEAITSFTVAIQINPELSNAYSNRGALLMKKNQFFEAIVDFEKSIELTPAIAIPHINLGEALRLTQDLDGAIAQFEIAEKLDPKDWRIYWNKSLALLLGGEFAPGFSLYEHRFSAPTDEKRDFVQALWLGNIPLRGKTILIHCEQGLGDTIQFSRYIPMVANMGAHVIFEVQKPLLGLLRNLKGVTKIIERGDTLPPFDYHCPLMSLPHAFHTEENSIPRQDKYISASDASKEKWRKKLGVSSQPLVGIVWSGNVNHKGDHNRSITLSSLVEILPKNYRYISLQKEVRPYDQLTLDRCPWIEHFGDALVDFTETAALSDLMDVVISVDTSVAHLAAALGRPTWILLPYTVDWRWMLDRPDSPWYPSVKLYRQEKLGRWDDVLQRVAKDLRLLVDNEGDAA
jgi:tetratricopeptide (TPR) repeat protein